MNKKSSLNSVACLIFGNYDAMLITILVIVIGFEVWRIYLLLKVNNQRKNLQSIDIEEQQEDKNEEVEIPENLQTLPKLYDFESYTSEFLYDTPETPYMYNKKRRKNFFDLCIETIHENIKEVDYNAKILADDLNVERTNLYKKLKHLSSILQSSMEVLKPISHLQCNRLIKDIDFQKISLFLSSWVFCHMAPPMTPWTSFNCYYTSLLFISPIFLTDKLSSVLYICLLAPSLL